MEEVLNRVQNGFLPDASISEGIGHNPDF